MKSFLPLFCLVAIAPVFCSVPEGGVVEELIGPIEAAEADFGCEPSPSQECVEVEGEKEDLFDSDLDQKPPEKRWYFTVKPAYYYFKDPEMRTFFDDGGFTFRAETGCKFYGPFIVWLDVGYFQKTGYAIGGAEELKLKLATITLGLKGIYYFNESIAVFGGAGPRLFMMLLHNDSPFVRGDDNAIGIGGGFDLGFWLFPTKKWKNFYIEIFADYSWKNLKIDEDEISSFDSDVDVSGLTAGGGIGIKF